MITLVYNAICVGLGPLAAGALSDCLAPALGARRLQADLERASLGAEGAAA